VFFSLRYGTEKVQSEKITQIIGFKSGHLATISKQKYQSNSFSALFTLMTSLHHTQKCACKTMSTVLIYIEQNTFLNTPFTSVGKQK
jgi:hypothetical protein